MNELKLNVVDSAAVSPSTVKSTNARDVKSSDAADVKSGSSLPQKKSGAGVTEVNQAQFREAVSSIMEYAQQSERRLDFQLDEDSGQTVIRVYDKHSSELIRQIPSELVLELAQKLNDEEPTVLFSAQV